MGKEILLFTKKWLFSTALMALILLFSANAWGQAASATWALTANGNASTTLYVYAETGTTPNCWAENSFDITINVTPTPDDPADVTACDKYILPSLTVGDYYTGTGKTGTMKNAGDEITASTTLYVYAETGTTPNCWAENSIDITINVTPTPDEPADVTACDKYILPSLTVGDYYTGTGKTGTMKNAGDEITASTTLYVYAETGTTPNCWAENSFDITINVTPTPDDPADVTACDKYILPSLTVGDYYTGTGKTGTMKNAGDEITASTTLYVYAETGTTPNCWAENSIDITINVTPTPDEPADVTACDKYILPSLTVGDYYTGTGKTGTMKNAGDEITASTTLYVYAETGTTPNCWAENSFDITINVTPTPDDPADVTACDKYILPSLTVGDYYTGTGKTGTMKNAGDEITASTTLYVYAETGTTPNCWAENSFDITINVTPTPDDPADVTACDKYILPSLTVGDYYTGTGKTGTMKNAGDEITASTTLYVYAETGTTPNCWAENSFDITINVTPTITPDPTPINVKYSEAVDVSVIFADEDVENLLIETEWKKVGSSSYTSGLPGDLSFDEITTGEWELTGNIFLAVGSYEIRITADDGDCIGEALIPLIVSCEDALVEYIGGTYFTTNTNGSGFVFLETTVVDEDNIGDVTNTTITFTDGGTVLGTPNIPVGLVNESVTSVGYATTNFSYQLNNSEMSGGGKTWEVVATVGGLPESVQGQTLFRPYSFQRFRRPSRNVRYARCEDCYRIQQPCGSRTVLPSRLHTCERSNRNADVSPYHRRGSNPRQSAFQAVRVSAI
jgi:hypothetical protein